MVTGHIIHGERDDWKTMVKGCRLLRTISCTRSAAHFNVRLILCFALVSNHGSNWKINSCDCWTISVITHQFSLLYVVKHAGECMASKDDRVCLWRLTQAGALRLWGQFGSVLEVKSLGCDADYPVPSGVAEPCSSGKHSGFFALREEGTAPCWLCRATRTSCSQ